MTDASSRWARLDAAARYQAIVDASPDAIIGKSLDGVITDWNPAAERIYGWSAKEAIGQSIYLVVPEERRREVESVLARVAEGEQVEEILTTRLHKDGHQVAVSVTAAPAYDRFDRLVGAVVIACDRSRADDAEEQARALSTERRVLADRLDSEVLRPLAAASSLDEVGGVVEHVRRLVADLSESEPTP